MATETKEANAKILEMPKELVERGRYTLASGDSARNLIRETMASLNDLLTKQYLANQGVWKEVEEEMAKQGLKLQPGEQIKFSYLLDKFFVESAPVKNEDKKGE